MKVRVETVRTIWVTVEVDATWWNKEDQNDEAYLDYATDELLDALFVTEANNPDVHIELESLDSVEVLPQN